MKRLIYSMSLAFLSIIAVRQAAVAAGCNDLLSQGIYNHVQVSLSSSNVSSQRTAACASLQTYHSTNHSADIRTAASYLGISGSLAGGYTDAQLDQLVSASCATSDAELNSAYSNTIVQASIDPGIVQAFNNCTQAAATNLRASYSFAQDGSSVTFSVNYVAPGGGGVYAQGAKITQTSLDKVHCAGNLLGRTALGTSAKAITCTRDVQPVTPYSYQTGRYWALPVTIDVATDTGQILTAFLPGIPAGPTPLSVQIPIGAIIDWYRATLADPIPIGFAVADGSAVTDKASPFFGSSTPDLRGMFTRGIQDYTNAAQLRETGGRAALDQDGAITWTPTISEATTGPGAPSCCGGYAGVSYYNNNNDKTTSRGDHTHVVSTLTVTAHNHGANGSIIPPYVGVVKIIRIR